MKINNLKVNGFGKLKNKEINLSSGINIIYGENESGKSSLLKFISSMLYGVAKTKNGKDITDFDKYNPWETEEYSGKIWYTLDNGESFEVYREFKKKNPTIFNSSKKDISKEFPVEKNKTINFFKEQTGVDEETFYSTAITEQEGVKLSKSSQNNVIQKMSNLVSSGNDNISFKRAIDRINKKQNEEVGTERTLQRPINVVENRIDKLMSEKKDLEIYKEKMNDNIFEKDNLAVELKEEEIKKEFLKEVKNKQDNNRLRNAEINLNKNLELEYNKKIEELEKTISSNEKQKEYKKVNYRNYYIVLSILGILFIVLMLINNGKFILFNLLALVPVLLLIFKLIKEKKNEKQNREEIKYNSSKIKSELEVLNLNRNSQMKEVNEKESKLLQEIERENKELIDKYRDLISIEYIQKNLVQKYDEILKEIEEKEKNINILRFKLQTIENKGEELNEKLERLAQIDEELEDVENEREELISLNNSYNIARECLELAYEEAKQNIAPKFTENLENIISKISNNKYSNVFLSDDEEIKVEIKNGNYIPISLLSVGTIDQMYLSLRLSVLNEITTEKMPIILDEAFSYFDEERLTNILKYLNDNFQENQIIIFTCSNREMNCLNDLNINYTITEM